MKTYIPYVIFLCSLFFLFPLKAQDCAPFVSSNYSGTVRVTIFSENGECFTLKKLNAILNPSPANQVEFSTNIGFTPLEVKLVDGTIITKKIALPENALTATYKVFINKKGAYDIKLLPAMSTGSGPTAQELMEQANATREAFVQEQKAKSAADDNMAALNKIQQMNSESKNNFDAATGDGSKTTSYSTDVFQNNVISTNTSSNTSFGNTSNTNTNNSDFIQTSLNSPSPSAPQSGTGITLKLSNGSSPAPGWNIQIACLCNTNGKGVTNSQGIVVIPASDIRSKSIDVYGTRGDESFKLEGVVTLDSFNYAEIDPSQVIKMINDKVQELEKINEMSEEELYNMFGY
ncbi:MAG: hypothetical protein H6579_06645 [Chitinophagales bacterium]|nr:hypothetical protein [Chitinophagales bacterium]